MSWWDKQRTGQLRVSQDQSWRVGPTSACKAEWGSAGRSRARCPVFCHHLLFQSPFTVSGRMYPLPRILLPTLHCSFSNPYFCDHNPNSRPIFLKIFHCENFPTQQPPSPWLSFLLSSPHSGLRSEEIFRQTVVSWHLCLSHPSFTK